MSDAQPGERIAGGNHDEHRGAMSDNPGAAAGGTNDGVLPEPAQPSMPWAVQRIRRQLYWQAAFAFLRASVGLLAILLVAQTVFSLGTLIAAIVFTVGSAVAAASLILARQVKSHRQTVRGVIVGLEAAVGTVYGLLTLQALAGSLEGRGLVAVAFNVVGLLIAGSVFRNSLTSEARSWFSWP